MVKVIRVAMVRFPGLLGLPMFVVLMTGCAPTTSPGLGDVYYNLEASLSSGNSVALEMVAPADFPNPSRSVGATLNCNQRSFFANPTTPSSGRDDFLDFMNSHQDIHFQGGIFSVGDVGIRCGDGNVSITGPTFAHVRSVLKQLSSETSGGGSRLSLTIANGFRYRYIMEDYWEYKLNVHLGDGRISAWVGRSGPDLGNEYDPIVAVLNQGSVVPVLFDGNSSSAPFNPNQSLVMAVNRGAYTKQKWEYFEIDFSRASLKYWQSNESPVR